MIRPDFLDGTGEPILFLNSSNTNYSLFSAVMANLAHDFTVIGHNYRSVREERSGDFTIDDLADDTFDVMAGPNFERWNIVGSSMGGFVALNSVLRRPDSIARLVLIGTSATRTDEQTDLVLQAISQLQDCDRVPTEWAQWAMQICLSEDFRTRRPEVVARWVEQITTMSAENIASEFRASASRRDLTSSLSRIKCPVLVIHGTEDPAFSVEETFAWASCIPGAKVEILPGVGHFVTEEVPELTAELIRDFMRQT